MHQFFPVIKKELTSGGGRFAPLSVPQRRLALCPCVQGPGTKSAVGLRGQRTCQQQGALTGRDALPKLPVSASLQLFPWNPAAGEFDEIVVRIFCTIVFCHFLCWTKDSTFRELLADIQHKSYPKSLPTSLES